ncbi:MAG TPA: GlsB/YeaQ/YmgE family stress response membrane protein [Candidatus Methylacidiphilales bacterium]|nr:GlsB/YeaQ/YmgE family stress response membrane protein [Candidatus Methylacidiphilales bacterium]
MLHFIWYIIVGFLAGLIAQWIMGAGGFGFIGTVLIGIAGSVIGGFVARLFSKPAPGTPFHPAGFLMSIVGAVILLFILSKV